MSRSVLLLLSILVVRGHGCSVDSSQKDRVSALLGETKSQGRTGFREVFPTNYYVYHRFNASLFCSDNSCCVFPAAMVLSDSWFQLLRHLYRENTKYTFIRGLISLLKEITKEKFLETPDLSIFPNVSSTPEELLSLTEQVLSKWQELKCPSAVSGCMFPTVSTDQDDEEELEMAHSVEGDSRPLQDLEREPERGKRWSLTAAPTNVGTALWHIPGYILWSIILLLTALEW